MHRLVRRWRSLCLLLAVAVSLAVPAQAMAENISVTIGVGDTTVLFTGTTSPNALVTIIEGGVVVGTTTANPAGNYTKLLTGQNAGIHTYQLAAQDTVGRFTDTVSIVTNVPEHAQTTISTFLPPTIEFSDNQVSPGAPLRIKGATAPNASVVVYIDNTTSATVNADAAGDWVYDINTTTTPPGTHELYVTATKTGVGQSHPSDPRHFTILRLEEPQPPTPPGTPPGQPQPSPGLPSAPSTQPGRPQPPVITAPTPGQVVGTSTVEVTGTAEPGTQVEVWNRGQVVGSVFTDTRGNWRMTISLNDFINEIKARACREGVCSDFSATVQFYYQAPARGAGPEIKLDRYRWQAYVRDQIGINAALRGGDTPYVVLVEWGDGSTDTYRTSGSRLLLEHAYQKSGKYNGKVTLTDEQGRKAVAYFSVEVKTKKLVLSWLRFWWWFLAVLIGILLLLWALRRLYTVRKKDKDEENSRSKGAF